MFVRFFISWHARNPRAVQYKDYPYYQITLKILLLRLATVVAKNGHISLLCPLNVADLPRPMHNSRLAGHLKNLNFNCTLKEIDCFYVKFLFYA